MAKRVAIDLGTSNSLVLLEEKGIVVNEPTVVAYSKKEKKVIAVGLSAKEMIGRSPADISVVRPLRQGVIASFKFTHALLSHLLHRALGRIIIFRPEVMVSVPAGLTSVEERAVIEAAHSAGAGKVYLLPEPVAAALGAGLPIHTPNGNMIVNMGGGTAEIAVISLNGLVRYESKRISGDAVNEAIQVYMKRTHNLFIGEQMAENIKINIGSARKLDNPILMEVRGTNNVNGLPQMIEINSNDLVEPIKEVLMEIINAVKVVLEGTPPELVSDIIDRGIALSGGTALIRKIDILFTQALGVPVHVVDNPLTAVVEGVAIALRDIDDLRRSLKGN